MYMFYIKLEKAKNLYECSKGKMKESILIFQRNIVFNPEKI